MLDEQGEWAGRLDPEFSNVAVRSYFRGLDTATKTFTRFERRTGTNRGSVSHNPCIPQLQRPLVAALRAKDQKVAKLKRANGEDVFGREVPFEEPCWFLRRSFWQR